MPALGTTAHRTVLEADLGQTYDPIFGYGCVDANTAVAEAKKKRGGSSGKGKR